MLLNCSDRAVAWQIHESKNIELSVSQASSMPQHVAIIMDGNGRWAQKKHLPRTVGHTKGAAIVRPLIEQCIKSGVQCLTLFAFSTENWNRPADEVSTLMGLFLQYLEKELDNLAKAGVRFKVIGDVTGFNPELQQRIAAAEAKTASNQAITLAVAANYGGRWDVVQSVRSWLKAHPDADPAQLTESDLSQGLSTAGLPDLDLLIRTGGERRISNFLLWQAAYAELYFTDVLWPDFDGVEFEKALDWFSKRSRRFGKTDEQVTRSSRV